MSRFSIRVSQNRETRDFEIRTTDKHNPDNVRTEIVQNPTKLLLSVEHAAGQLAVVESGALGGYGFRDLDLDEAMIAFDALAWATAAQQTYVEEPSDTVKALRRMDTEV